MIQTVKKYYQLAKPGIIYGNALNTAGGFLFASMGHVNPRLLLTTLVGSSLVIGGGCVYNNYLDREIDAKMARTKKRSLVDKTIPVPAALLFATILATMGLLVLGNYTNLLTVYIGLFGLFAYVAIYGTAKRTTLHSTLIGSISGAVPVVAGYTAVTNQLDTPAWLLGLVLACWQMPHFYAIAVYRMKEYKAAGLPILTVQKGIGAAKRQIFAYTVLFIFACWLLWHFGHAGTAYLTIVTILGLRWLYQASLGFSTKDDDKWAKGMFGFSLLVILGLDIALSLAFLFR